MSNENTHTTVFAGRDESASETLRKIGKEADSTGKKLTTIGSGVALGNMLTSVLRDVKNFAQQSIGAYQSVGAEVLKLQRSTGGTAEDASKLRFAFHETGLDADAAAKSIRVFSKHVAANDTAIKNLSVTTRDANGNLLSTNAVLLNVADRFASMPNGIQKTALAAELFGRSGLQMLPFLNKGKQGLIELEAEAQKYGLILTQDNLDAIQKNIVAHREYEAALSGARIQIGMQLLPIMSQMTQQFTDFLIEMRPVIADMTVGLKPAIEEVSAALKVALGIFAAFMKFLSEHQDAAGLLVPGFVALAGGVTLYRKAATLAKAETIGLNAALLATPVGIIALLLAGAAALALDPAKNPNPLAPSGIGGRGGISGNQLSAANAALAARNAKAAALAIAAGKVRLHDSGASGGDAVKAATDKPPYKPPSTTKKKTSGFNLAKAVGEDYAKGLEGTTANIAAEITKMINTAYSAAKAGKSDPTQLINALKTQQKQLQALAVDRDLTIKRLTEAQTKLKDLQTQSTQLSDQIASGIVSSFSITSGNNPQTLSEMLSGMTRNVDRAKQLADALKKLKDQGLDPALLKDIATAGTERGLDVAQQILIGGASGVQSLNTLQSAIAIYARQAGDTVGDATYAGGISIAQKLVDSLTDDKAKILASIQDLATSIEKIFDASLTALDRGAQGKADAFAKQIKDLVNKYPGAGVTIDPTQVTAPSMSSARAQYGDLFDTLSAPGTKSGDSYHITVTDSFGSTDIAQKVVTTIAELKRTNGGWL